MQAALKDSFASAGPFLITSSSFFTSTSEGLNMAGFRLQMLQKRYSSIAGAV